jgi:hypothetical protein
MSEIQYNIEIDRIWEEIKKINDDVLSYVIEKTGAMENWDIIRNVLTTKSEDGNFLFGAGQEENEKYVHIQREIETLTIEWKKCVDTMLKLGTRMQLNDYIRQALMTPKTQADLFLSNCLLTGVDEVDKRKIENLKKVKFV